MRKRNMTIWVTVLVLSLVTPQIMGRVVFDDGQIHNIDYEINDEVFVDLAAPEMYTTVNLLPGGNIYYCLEAYNNSRVNIYGGRIGEALGADDSSQINISGGSIQYLDAEDSSEVTISGGFIEQNLYSIESSHVTVTGGSIGYEIIAGIPTHPHYGHYFDESIITFVGSNFAINGQSVNYGWYSVFDYPSGGILTGTLANEVTLNNPFFVREGSSIVLVPEPATILLLGLGAMMLRKKRNT